MPLFFFDTNDGRTFMRDEEGCEASNSQAARDLALEAVAGMVNDRPTLQDHRVFTVDVHDEGGRRIYRATVEVAGEWVS